MTNQFSRAGVRTLMERYGIRPTHSLGQNFLTDGNILRKITELLEPEAGDTVCEVGPGLGALTQEIAARGVRLVAVEKDARMVPALSDVMSGAPNVEIVTADFLDYDLSALPRGYKLTGNLPYYITTPALMKAVEPVNVPSLAVFMMQREVAERICAAPGGKEYGAVSVAVQYRCRAEYAMNVSREVFLPKPRVDSAVIVLRPDLGHRGVPKDEGIFLAAVKAGFGQRRKMLRNALSALVPDAGALDAAFERAGVKGTARAETLSVEEFIALADAICGF